MTRTHRIVNYVTGAVTAGVADTFVDAELNAAKAEAVLAFAQEVAALPGETWVMLRAEDYVAAQGWLPQEPKEGQG